MSPAFTHIPNFRNHLVSVFTACYMSSSSSSTVVQKLFKTHQGRGLDDKAPALFTLVSSTYAILLLETLKTPNLY